MTLERGLCPMNNRVYGEFVNSDDTLRVYVDDELVFSSGEERLQGLLNYIDSFAAGHRAAVILDKITGNAAALLSIKAVCHEVYSPVGSQLAVETLDKYGIRHHLDVIVPYIQRAGGEEMCPMEKLSMNKDPDEFYAVVSALMNRTQENCDP